MVGLNKEVERFRRGHLYHIVAPVYDYKARKNVDQSWLLLFCSKTSHSYRFKIVAYDPLGTQWSKRTNVVLYKAWSHDTINTLPVSRVLPDELLIYSHLSYKSPIWDSFFMDTPKKKRPAKRSWHVKIPI